MKTETKYTKEQHEQLITIAKEDDDVKRWQMIHDFLAECNPIAAREQRKQAKEMAKVREEGLYNDKKAPGKAGLRFAVSIPNTTYQALVELDVALRGKSKLREPEKGVFKHRNATNAIARKLSEAFPQYRAS